jgi:hypothetical protein
LPYISPGMSSKISDEEITELCKAIEVYQSELIKSENEMKELKFQLENATEKLKLYEVRTGVLSTVPNLSLWLAI